MTKIHPEAREVLASQYEKREWLDQALKLRRKPARLDEYDLLALKGISQALFERDALKGAADVVYNRLMPEVETLRAQVAEMRGALGAHAQADAYAGSFPDDDADAKYLRKQEVFWRMTAKKWLDYETFGPEAKARMMNDPEVKAVHKRLSSFLTKDNSND